MNPCTLITFGVPGLGPYKICVVLSYLVKKLDFNDSFLPRAITPYDFKLVRTLFVVSVYRLYRSKKKVEVKLALSIYHQRPQAPSGSGPTAYENLAAARRWRRSSGGAAVAVAAAMRRQQAAGAGFRAREIESCMQCKSGHVMLRYYFPSQDGRWY